MKKNQQNKQILNRISRIEGQLKGIKKMIENENECVDVIGQVLAVREAVSALGVEILKNDFVCKKSVREFDERYLKTLFKVRGK